MSVETVFAAVVAFVTGTGLNSLLRFISRNKETDISTEAVLRQEMFDRLDMMAAEIEDLKKEVNYWREKYFEIYKEHADLRARLGIIENLENKELDK